MSNLYKDIDLSTIGGRIRAARISQNLLIKELAEKSNIHVSTISSIEHNKHYPDFNTLDKLSNALDVSIAYLGAFHNMPENTLDEKIKKARFFHGHSRPQCSKHLGIHVRTVFGWEQQNRKPIGSVKEKLDSYLEILKEK